MYNQIEEFHGNFTSDGSSTQIHACGREVGEVTVLGSAPNVL